MSRLLLLRMVLLFDIDVDGDVVVDVNFLVLVFGFVLFPRNAGSCAG